jgi:hypothetical protein
MEWARIFGILALAAAASLAGLAARKASAPDFRESPAGGGGGEVAASRADPPSSPLASELPGRAGESGTDSPAEDPERQDSKELGPLLETAIEIGSNRVCIAVEDALENDRLWHGLGESDRSDLRDILRALLGPRWACRLAEGCLRLRRTQEGEFLLYLVGVLRVREAEEALQALLNEGEPPGLFESFALGMAGGEKTARRASQLLTDGWASFDDLVSRACSCALLRCAGPEIVSEHFLGRYFEAGTAADRREALRSLSAWGSMEGARRAGAVIHLETDPDCRGWILEAAARHRFDDGWEVDLLCASLLEDPSSRRPTGGTGMRRFGRSP